MNNSKKFYEKSSEKIYSRSDKAITLIALIVTIIILLILAGVTINMAVSNQGIFNKAKTATRAYKNAAEGEQAGLDAAEKEMNKYLPGGTTESSSDTVVKGKGTTLPASSFPRISVNGLKYADIDGDGIADGIIVADISKDSTDTTTYKGGNPWGGDDVWGSFSYKVTSGLREYSENKSYKYTNADGSTVDGTLVKCTNSTGTPMYYIISLANYDNNAHYWYKNAINMNDDSTFTSKDFGKGKKNTEKMIDRMKNHSDKSQYSVDYGEATTGTNADIWNIIEDKVKEGWFVPSESEWAAFASYLNTSETSTDTNYYENYGLSNWCWGSTGYKDVAGACVVQFGNGAVGYTYPYETCNLRLCATF